MKTALVLSIGVVNINNGNTMYDWGIYDEFWNNTMYAFLANDFLIFSTNEDDFEINEPIILRNNDSNRKIKESTITDKSIVNKDELMEMLKRNGFDYTQLRPFQARKAYNRKLITSYSVKGIK
jgi:hypothetical protein